MYNLGTESFFKIKKSFIRLNCGIDWVLIKYAKVTYVYMQAHIYMHGTYNSLALVQAYLDASPICLWVINLWTCEENIDKNEPKRK